MVYNMDARHVCEHTGDCSIWMVSHEGKKSKICDCGALRAAVYEAHGEGRIDDNLFKAWEEHLRAIDKSMEQ